jgi:hypothetical protein
MDPLVSFQNDAIDLWRKVVYFVLFCNYDIHQATLDPNLQFGSPKHELSFKLFFFWFGSNWFPSKMMPSIYEER